MSQYSEIDMKQYRKKKLYDRYFSEINGKILDIGCSIGHFIQHSPNQIIGIDVDRDALLKCRQHNFTCIYSNIVQGLPFCDESFAAVSCDSVVEHLPEPLNLIREIYRVLKPGGKVIVITPNIYRIKNRFWMDYTHVRPFCPKSLLSISYDGGFKKCIVRSYSLNYSRIIEPLISVNKFYNIKPLLWRMEDIIGKLISTNIFMQGIK